MAFCGQCGSALETADQFCGECGAPIQATAATAATTSAATSDVPTSPPPTAAPPGPAVAPAPAAAAASSGTDQRLALWGGVGALILLLLVGVFLVTRDGDDTAQDGSVTTVPEVAPDSSVIEVPTTALATVPATASPTTSVAPETTTATTQPPAATTVPATTTPPAATVPTVPAGWSPATIPPQAYPRLSEENLIGVPSPQIVDFSAPVPDGLYRTSYISNDGITLTLDLYRFETCEILGYGPCLEGPYLPSEVGASATPEATVDVPLDATTTVIISGWDCGQVIGQGNGTDLAAMYAALAADYDLAFGAALSVGTDPYDLMEIVNANPAARFGPPPAQCNDYYSLVWQYESAPPVYVQWAFDWDTGGAVDPGSLLVPSAIAVSGDSTTVYIYAGFYS